MKTVTKKKHLILIIPEHSSYVRFTQYYKPNTKKKIRTWHDHKSKELRETQQNVIC